jgi:hypothetical protein
MMWLLKLLFDQNSIMINHMLSGDFKSYITLEVTQNELVAYFYARICSIKKKEQKGDKENDPKEIQELPVPSSNK